VSCPPPCDSGPFATNGIGFASGGDAGLKREDSLLRFPVFTHDMIHNRSV